MRRSRLDPAQTARRMRANAGQSAAVRPISDAPRLSGAAGARAMGSAAEHDAPGAQAPSGATSRLAARLARRPRLALILVFLAALAIFLPGQATLPPTDRDEARFAQASRQMLETGDFLDIRFQDSARYNKPVGAYWLQAAAAWAAGGADAPIWAYRAPSLLAAALAVALTAWAARPLTGGAPGLLAAGLMATCVILAAEARLAKTDAPLLAATLLAMGALARVLLVEGGRRWSLVFWAAVGAGALIKGPIILAPVAGALLGVMLARRSVAPLAAIRPLQGLAVVAAIAAPWLVAITLKSDGAFWSQSVGRDLLGKLAGGMESHGGPPGWHLIAAIGVFWPWAALVPFAAPWAWRRRREPAVAFLLGWAALTWVIFEATPTKLPHYTLPAWPALAMLLAAALLAPGALPQPGAWARRAAVALWAPPALALTLAAVVGPWVIMGAPAPGAALIGLVGGGAAVLAGRALWRWRLHAFAPLAAAASALSVAAVLHFALPALTLAFPAPQMARLAAAHRCGDTGPVAVTTYREPSVVFALGTDTLMTDGAGAAAALAEGRAALAWVGDPERAAFDAAAGGMIALETLAAFNYSNGKRVTLTLFKLKREGAACVA
ncbi:MAG: glycosyl transferase [Rhodobacterales bacterium CG_4_9_14_3_um_filter_71_31]|nr:MAG: glycosyl transferase [Rhodobacterales bacterium CG_4_9_14_3_um_filter_71_31]